MGDWISPGGPRYRAPTVLINRQMKTHLSHIYMNWKWTNYCLTIVVVVFEVDWKNLQSCRGLSEIMTKVSKLRCQNHSEYRENWKYHPTHVLSERVSITLYVMCTFASADIYELKEVFTFLSHTPKTCKKVLLRHKMPPFIFSTHLSYKKWWVKSNIE